MVREHPGGCRETGNGRAEIKEAVVTERNVLCVFCLQDAGLHFLHSELFLSLDLFRTATPKQFSSELCFLNFWTRNPKDVLRSCQMCFIKTVYSTASNHRLCYYTISQQLKTEKKKQFWISQLCLHWHTRKITLLDPGTSSVLGNISLLYRKVSFFFPPNKPKQADKCTWFIYLFFSVFSYLQGSYCLQLLVLISQGTCMPLVCYSVPNSC